ncbi:hypothetical protein ACRAWG_00380 [Methylobacterium sp. P31]
MIAFRLLTGALDHLGAGAPPDKYLAETQIAGSWEIEDDVNIRLRLRRKRREPPVQVRTFKDLHARNKRQGSAPDHASPVATASHASGQGTEAAASQTGQDVVMNHVLV